jgi:pyruvate/2-oxoglutarate dehydrogenase complex dihydrolipoamide dehydrogenase (E3) component
VEVRLGVRLAGVTPGRSGASLRVETDRGHELIEVDAILVATGRSPNVDGLGLEAAGVEVEGSRVRVDDTLRTSNRRIYASGDVCLPVQLTHAADASSRAVVQNALFPGPKKRLSRMVIPWCTFTDPEIAHVGLTLAQAAAAGVEVDTVRVEMGEVDRARTEGHPEGFLTIHLARGDDRIVGATLAARHAGEIISELAVAIAGKRGLGSLAGVIHPYPTRAEIVRKAADAFNRTRLSPTLGGILRRWFDWRR